MAVVKTKPTSPGRRFVVKVVNPDLHKGKPHRSLVKGLKKTGGRNNYGRITTRHHGGGHKRRYRIIDFKRHDKDGVQARVIRLEYDPNRSGHIALLRYIDGEYRYILAPRGLAVNDKVVSGSQSPIKVGNCLPITNIPVGTVVCAVELRPGKGAQLARSAGSSVQIAAKEGRYAFIKLQSGELRRVLLTARACIGVMSNAEHNLRKLGKAGAKRWRGIRPTVRGVAMNPVDHPHGGGEGKTSGGRHPVSPWGVQTKGKRTRCNKRTDNDIIRRRKKKK